jgi:peptidoglycan biosynthesis protein MviN/MurJ (putative lipid II flippase)
LIDLVINVTLALTLAPTLGLWAPAVAVVFATYIHKIYFLIIVRQKLELKLGHIFPWKYLLLITIGNALLGWAFWMIRQEISHDWIGFSVGALLYAIIWGLAAWFERKRSF